MTANNWLSRLFTSKQRWPHLYFDGMREGYHDLPAEHRETSTYTTFRGRYVQGLRTHGGTGRVVRSAVCRADGGESGAVGGAGLMPKYAVASDGGLTIVFARDKREAERMVRRDLAERNTGLILKAADYEATARVATDEDIAWHKAMGGHGGDL